MINSLPLLLYPSTYYFKWNAYCNNRTTIFLFSLKNNLCRFHSWELVACVKARHGRFLQWQNGDWWEELSADNVHEKITTSMYDILRKFGVKKTQQSTTSDTSVFLSYNKRQKVGDECINCGC